jgi:transposase
LLAEHGYVLARGARTILRRVTTLADDSAACVSEPLRVTLLAAVAEVHALEEKLATVDGQLRQVADAHPVAARLQTIPGVGAQTATAMVAAVGHIDGFRRGGSLPVGSD